MELPEFTNRQYASASVLNTWMKELLYQHAFFNGGNGPFAMREVSGYGAANDGTKVSIWSGHILYTGDTATFRYSLYLMANGGVNTGNADVLVNGVVAATVDDTAGHLITGSVTLSGLTGGTVYPVEVRAWRSGTSSSVTLLADVYWLGLVHTPTYTAMTTWTAGNTVSAAQLGAIRSNLVALQTCVNMPIAPTPEAEGSREFDDLNTSLTVWRGRLYRRCATLRVMVDAWADEGKGAWEIKINGVVVYNEQVTGAEQTYTADLTLSSYVSVGSEYQVDVTINRSGTVADDIVGYCRVKQVREYSSAAATAVTPLSHGDTLTHTALNLYKTMIDQYHPGAASPTFPAYYQQPAVYSCAANKYHLQNLRPYLRYAYDGNGGTPEIEPYSGGNISLPTTDTCYVLANATGLVYGGWYAVDDCDYAQEANNAEA